MGNNKTKIPVWTPDTFDEPKEYAEEQWQWIEGFIKTLRPREFTLETLHYLYTTAFIKGWHEGVEKEVLGIPKVYPEINNLLE